MRPRHKRVWRQPESGGGEDKVRREAIEVRNFPRFKCFALLTCYSKRRKRRLVLKPKNSERNAILLENKPLNGHVKSIWIVMTSRNERNGRNGRRRRRQMLLVVMKEEKEERKSGGEQGEEDQAMFSEEDDAGKPTKKVNDPRWFLPFFIHSLSAAF